jgi:hypothetical protein
MKRATAIHAGFVTRSLAALAALAIPLGACDNYDGGDGGDDGRYRPAAVEPCLEEKVENFVRIDTINGARPSWLKGRFAPGVLSRATKVMIFEPLDPTFGEEVDGVITSPAPAAFIFFRAAHAAERHEGEADTHRSNLLVAFARDPLDSQREAIDDCLER